MAINVTAVEVKALLAPYAESSDAVITLALEQASLLVEEDLLGAGLSAGKQRIIGLNLAAHFAVVAIERGGFTFQQAGEAREGYATDRNQVKFSSTRFGQQALAMDDTGILARLDAPKGKAEFRVIEQRDY